ncbi:MAG TPA: HEPN domain-containing protein [Pseudolabrys sp.]|nr:HEPN domain-containing protein [Pseudolabrys sp.]
MTILEERGLFWWGDEPIPDRQFAPDSSVVGLLKIENDGRISLELDGYLPNKHGPMSAMMQAELPDDKTILGILKGSNKHVLLSNLIGGGGQFTTSGMSYERYIAVDCLIADRTVPDFKNPPRFRKLEIPLDGFEEWLRLGAIKVVRSKRMISANYKWPKESTYRCDNVKMSLAFDISGKASARLFGDEFTIKETASIALQFNAPSTLDYIKSQYLLLEDLFILLTDSDYPLDWPWVSSNKKARYRLYFLKLRTRNEAIAPKYHECCTNFIQLRDQFGSIWSRWKEKRETFGPGFYLYLGTRRRIKLYAEHRFVNLIWGIEAFHRKKHLAQASEALTRKIERIIAQIQAPKDRKWLSKKLGNVGETPLGQRIFETFNAVPLGIEPERLRAFAEACAQRRNDISHFGGERHGFPYNDFIQDLENKSSALSALYHALLLHEIGIDEKIVKHWMYESFRSYLIKHYFVAGGHLDKSILAPKP